MKLKRILASILAATVLSASASAFTPYFPETGSDEPQPSENTTTETDNDSFFHDIPSEGLSQIQSEDYLFMLFKQILEAYVENHLYEFTAEDVLWKFFYDFLGDNPMYFEYFSDYILGTMDPYSGYHEAESGFIDPDMGATGFGFMIKDSNEGVYIEHVVPGSNAALAGFEDGDKFISINGINIKKHTFDIVSALLANPDRFVEKDEESSTKTTESDTSSKEEATIQETTDEATADEAESNKIEITVERNGVLLTIYIEKGPMELSMIDSYIDENHGKPAAYIKVSSFLGETTDAEFIGLVKEYHSDGIKNLTIDLRDNGGGSLDFALAMAEIFLDKDELICYYNDRNLEEPTPIYSTTDKLVFDSISILVNENTASAAELFTSILKDKGLATVVGTQTFGKSLGQSVYVLGNGDYITITTYQMLDENLNSYDGKGIMPHLNIKNVEMCYILPPLLPFNHKNAAKIQEGVYSDAAKALEERMVLMGVLRQQYSDGVFDDITKTALYFMQKDYEMTATGYVDNETVSLITRVINSYKPNTYFDDAQYEVAMIVHRSFSQGKRLVNEKEKLRAEQRTIIEERDAKLNAEYDAKIAASNNNNKN